MDVREKQALLLFRAYEGMVPEWAMVSLKNKTCKISRFKNKKKEERFLFFKRYIL